MVQKVFKYGNSLAITLPREFTTAAGIEAGSVVDTAVQDGRVVVHAVEVVPKLSAQDQQIVDRVFEKRRRVFKALGE